MGTAQYLSPEQAQGHAVTATSDIYSIGVMLYEMLAGRLPFDGDSAVAVALKHLSEPPAPISQWRPGRAPGARGRRHGGAREGPGAALAVGGGLRRPGSRPRARRSRPGANGGQDTAAFAAIPMPAADETAPTQLAPDTAAGPRRPSASPRRRASGAGGGTRSALLALALLGVLLYLILSGVLATEKREVPRVTGKQLVEARALMERAGFEVDDRARAELAAVRPGRGPGPERGRGGRRGLDGDARGLGRPRRRARPARREPAAGPGDQRARGRRARGDARPRVLGQGEGGLRDPDRAAARAPRSRRARACGCW